VFVCVGAVASVGVVVGGGGGFGEVLTPWRPMNTHEKIVRCPTIRHVVGSVAQKGPSSKTKTTDIQGKPRETTN